MFVILGPGGPVAEVLHALRLVGAQDSVLYTPWATVIIFAYESLAVAIFVIYAVSERVTRGHLEAAASLGASAWYRFKHVIAPLLSPGILGAFLIIIVPMGGAFAESDILGGPNGQLAGNVINYQMNTAGDESMAATLSIALLIVLGLAVGLIYWAFRGIRRVRRGYAHQ
jgi:ABC-type spermidine/putrescine transport system permease subunit I